MIGLILLMGLVTKNAILLIDYANKLRRGGMARDAALGKAGNTRLRPIVMTTLAMIFGMLPLAFQIGAGSEIRAPMARAVIGGLITSTLLTLVAVPVVYSLLDDLTGKLFPARKESPSRGRRGHAGHPRLRTFRQLPGQMDEPVDREQIFFAPWTLARQK